MVGLLQLHGTPRHKANKLKQVLLTVSLFDQVFSGFFQRTANSARLFLVTSIKFNTEKLRFLIFEVVKAQYLKYLKGDGDNHVLRNLSFYLFI